MSTALVTGAAAGIGQGVVQRFLDGGWDVIALDRDREKLAAAWTNTPGVVTLAADVSVATEVDRALASTSVDSLAACVNVAGIYPPSSFLGFTEADYRVNFDVNVLGSLLVSRAALPHLRRSKSATIINFASTGAYAPGDGSRVLYKAAKAAVVSLTRSMGFELAPEGIQVVGIAPGPIETDGSVSGGDIAEFVNAVPLGRLGKPADMAEWVWALAGSSPLPFITGETIVVSGGAFMR